jgi:hypothetical protein
MITWIDKPYSLTLRGQKLLFKATSDENTNDGFIWFVEVNNTATGKQTSFLLQESPNYAGLLFDLRPLVELWNREDSLTMHKTLVTSTFDEPNGYGNCQYNIDITEYWLVDGVLTEGATDDASVIVTNGYYQPQDGYKPNVNNTTQPFGLGLASSSSRVWSDRFPNTHIPYQWYNPSKPSIWIPTKLSDYGLMSVPFKTSLDYNLVLLKIELTKSNGSIISDTITPSSSASIIHIGCFPANLSDSSITCKPDLYPDYLYYTITAKTSGGSSRSYDYNFYNAEYYGQFDCRYDRIRLAWVNSRGGWDYFNFIKKNEVTNQIERKQYKQLLVNDSGTFDKWQRQLTDRRPIVNRTINAISDWIQEGEYVFLRSLMVSTQVHMIAEDGTFIPVSISDNQFVEKKERNGKLYNVSINIKYSQDYWV